jgi:hypothetical protein
LTSSKISPVESLHDDTLTVCSIIFLAGIVGDVSHEGIGHALVALLTGTKSGVLSTVAWSSDSDSRLVAAGGTLVNLLVGFLLLFLLRRARRASPAARFFLFTACAFNLLTGTGYFFFSGVSDFGDWAVVIAGLSPHWFWRVLLILFGAAAYLLVTRILATSIVRDVGVPLTDRSRLRRLTYLAYFSAVALSVAGALPNPLGIKLIFESAIPAAAGGNCALLWLRHYAAKGTVPARPPAPISRSLSWIAASVVLSLAFIFILGRGISLHV